MKNKLIFKTYLSNMFHRLDKKGKAALLLILLVVGLLIYTKVTFAATATWTNGGGDGLWSTCANWSGGTGTGGCPGTSDIATFNSTSTADVAIDANVSVAGISIATGYSGQITQNSTKTITVGSSNFSQTTGTFIGGDSTIDINGSFTLSGGSFTATSGTMTVTGSLTITGAPTTVFTHNSGTVTFDGTTNSSSSIDASGVTFNLVIINRTIAGGGGVTLTIANGTTLPLGNSPTTTLHNSEGWSYYHLTNNGSISVGTGTWTSTIKGNITNNGTITGSNTAWTLNGSLINSGTVTMSSATSFDFNAVANSVVVDNTGSLTNNASSTFTTGSSPSFTINGSFVVNSASTFPASDVTLALDGAGIISSSVDASGVTFNTPVTISRTMNTGTDTTLTIASGTTIPLGNSPTSTLNNTWGGKVYSITNNGTITVGTGTWTLSTDGTLTNNGTITGSNTAWTINGNLTNAGTITMSSATTFTTTHYNDGGGTFTNNSGATFTPGSSPTFNISAGFVINSASTFPASDVTLNLNGTYNQGNSSIDASGVTFNTPVTISRTMNNGNNRTVTIASGTTIPLGNSPTITLNNTYGAGPNYGLVNNGTITIGTGTWTSSLEGGLTNNGTITGSNTAWTSNGPATNAGIITMSSATTFDINNYNDGTGNLTNNASSTLTTGASPTFTVNGSVNINSSSTFPSSAALTLDGTSGTQTLTASNVTFASLTKNAASTMAVGSSLTTGNLTYSSGTISNPGSAYTITVTGTFNQSSTGTLGGANLTLTFSGTGTQTISKSAGTFSSVLKVNKSSGSASLSTNMATSTQNCTVEEGVFDINGKTFTCGGTFTIEDGGTLRLYGSETPTSPTLNSGSTVSFKGNGDSAPTTYTITSLKTQYSNLSIDSTDSNDTFNLGAALDVDSNLTISSGIVDITAGNYDLTIGGNLTNNGTFTTQSGTVIFDTTGPSTISGTITFNSLTSTSGKTLFFTSGQTFTVNGVLTLAGALINSSDKSTQWLINHQGTESITNSYIVNSGCDASSTQITLDNTDTNGGNNGSCWADSSTYIRTRVKGNTRVEGNIRIK